MRQGGILSTDLYKLYNNDLFERLQIPGVGCHIGEISCVAPGCADDVAILTENKRILQLLVDIAVDFSSLERFLLQPVKSVLLQILQYARRSPPDDTVITMKGQAMPIVEEAMHVGILRSADSQETAVSHNIQKARRTVYSLMGSGLHGENGLDPETSIHLLQTYVLSVLVYGLEVVLPKASLMDKLERTYKKFVKHILSLPVTVADSAVYVLSGAMPIEGVIHKRALVMFGSLCRLDEDSVEKRLVCQQLTVKSFESSSWFVAVRKLFIKYDLPDCWDVIDEPQSKTKWKSTVHKQVNDYWAEHVKSRALMYTTLEYLPVDKYYPGKKHWLLQHSGIAKEIPTVHLKLKIVTGTYILQVNRSTFNQNEIDPTCLMCKEEPETVDHFLIRCSTLADVRKPIDMDSILRCAECFIQAPIETQVLTQLLLDCVGVFSDSKDIQVQSVIINIEKLANRLMQRLKGRAVPKLDPNLKL